MVKPENYAFPVPDDGRYNGIDIRTYLAAKAMEAMIIRLGPSEHNAEFAVQEADRLIKELNK